MSILKRQDNIQKSIDELFISNSRILSLINQISQLLRLHDKKVQILKKCFEKHNDSTTFNLFKRLILLNKIIMQFIIEPQQMLIILENIRSNQDNQFQILFNKKLIKPYTLYLMKRCQYLPKNSPKIDRMYQLMNLIQSGTAFSQILYTLGRYYYKQFPFAVDFNIILGNDLNTVYNQMIKYVPKPTCGQILFQFQKLHQKMYIVFYNCYYYKSLKPFVPRWILTDIQIQSQFKYALKNSTNIDSNKSLFETASSFNINKYSSKKFQFSSPTTDLTKSYVLDISPSRQQKFQQSLMLLKSMERVFQQIQDI